MNEYEKITRSIRKKVSKVTLEQQKEILKIYTEAIENMAKKAADAKEDSITKKLLNEFTKDLISEKITILKNISKSTTKSITKAAGYGIKANLEILKRIFDLTGVNSNVNYEGLFSSTKKKIINDIVSGKLYKDNKTLSDRIWRANNKFEDNIQYMINKGILEGKSSLELARDLETFIKEPARRPWAWSKVYPQLVGTVIDYNAQRLARTSINHSYQNSTIQSSNMNPFVEGIQWHSSLQHGRTCEVCRERHGEVFPKDNVPLDHPNGLCTMIPYILKDSEEVAGELRNWLDGEDNSVLDEWYQEYGLYFAFKEI